MSVKVKLNLHKLNPVDIIELHQKGIISLNEIKETKVAFACFTDMLHDYIKQEEEVIDETIADTALNDTHDNIVWL